MNFPPHLEIYIKFRSYCISLSKKVAICLAYLRLFCIKTLQSDKKFENTGKQTYRNMSKASKRHFFVTKR